MSQVIFLIIRAVRVELLLYAVGVIIIIIKKRVSEHKDRPRHCKVIAAHVTWTAFVFSINNSLPACGN